MIPVDGPEIRDSLTSWGWWFMVVYPTFFTRFYISQAGFLPSTVGCFSKSRLSYLDLSGVGPLLCFELIYPLPKKMGWMFVEIRNRTSMFQQEKCFKIYWYAIGMVTFSNDADATSTLSCQTEKRKDLEIGKRNMIYTSSWRQLYGIPQLPQNNDP